LLERNEISYLSYIRFFIIKAMYNNWQQLLSTTSIHKKITRLSASTIKHSNYKSPFS